MLEVRCSSMGIEYAADGVCICVQYEYYPSCKMSRTEKERGRGREREKVGEKYGMGGWEADLLGLPVTQCRWC